MIKFKILYFYFKLETTNQPDEQTNKQTHT